MSSSITHNLFLSALTGWGGGGKQLDDVEVTKIHFDVTTQC